MTPDENFELALTFTFQAEGGFVTDQGGPTEYGVTQANFTAWLAKHSLPNAPIHQITRSEAHDFYYEEFWTAPKLAGLTPFAPLTAIAAFDCGVNRYWVEAVEMLQAEAGVPQDGQIGPVTLTALASAISQSAGDLSFAQKYNQARRAFYRQLVAQKPEDAGDLEGWLNRCDHLDSYLGSVTIS